MSYSVSKYPRLELDKIALSCDDGDLVQISITQHGLVVDSLRYHNAIQWSAGHDAHVKPAYVSLPWPSKRPLHFYVSLKQGQAIPDWRMNYNYDDGDNLSMDSKNHQSTSDWEFDFELDRPLPLKSKARGQMLNLHLLSREPDIMGAYQHDYSLSIWLNAPINSLKSSVGSDYELVSRPSSDLSSNGSLQITQNGHATPLLPSPRVTSASRLQHSKISSESLNTKYLEIPEDSPLVRATLDELDKKCHSFRKILKDLVKAAEKQVDHLQTSEDVHSELTEAFTGIATQDTLRPLMDIYLAPVSRIQSQVIQKNQEMLRLLLISPLNKISDQLRDLSTAKKVYLDEAKIYNDHLSKYLSISPNAEATALSKADLKHFEAKQRFTTAKLASQQALKEFSLKQNDVLCILTKYAEALEVVSSSSSQARGPTAKSLSRFAQFQVADLVEATRRERERLAEQKDEALQNGSIGISPAEAKSDRSRKISFGLGISSSSSYNQLALSANNLANLANAGGAGSKLSLAMDRNVSGNVSTQSSTPQRRREGFLHVTNRNPKTGDSGLVSQWQRCWVVLSQGQLVEYKDAAADAPLTATNTPVNLKYACVRNSASSDRRFTFEVVTTQIRRLYQADSEEEAEAWRNAIQMQIEALLNGSSSMRQQDASRFRSFADELEHRVATEMGEKTPSSQSSPNLGSPRNLFSGLVKKASHKRKVSSPGLMQRGFGKRLSGSPSDLGNLPEASSSRTSLDSAQDGSSVGHNLPMPIPYVLQTTPQLLGESWMNGDQDFAQSVMSMSLSPSQRANPSSPPKISTREQLRRFQSIPGNDVCAECGASPATWSSFNIGVLLCLKCAGIHRGLGSHISKVRSIDLDEWSQPQIDTLLAMGNDKANSIYEAERRPAQGFDDKNDMVQFIRDKYVTKKWVKSV